ncbi:MAG: AMP-binding protein [Aeromicrobium sp.]|uniref:AMP-binding protein n=1 Tax=Aeromicrobium sp. TaxID=1871063 RepID=UPI0026026795|nr:AMP-binding protein [Aeromicrobium sp.]MDF1704911.1 AMP-binding protein [Aeromicrobium sp.]
MSTTVSSSSAVTPSALSSAIGQHTPVDDATVQRWRDLGWWEQRTIRSILSEAAQREPDRLALVGRRSNGQRPTRTYAELDVTAHTAANALASLGVGHGDAVVVMLPNWIEYAEIVFGVMEIGAMYAGVPVAYGPLQAAPILRRSKAKVLVVPRRWRSNENLELARELRREIPTLESIVVVDDEAEGLGDGEHRWSDLLDAPDHGVPAPRPDQLCYLGFTSGTTGEPKGAMHTHETLIYSARLQAEHLGSRTYGDPMVQLVASPVGHHTGFEWGIVFTALLAGTAVHVDRWDPAWGVEIVRAEGITAFFGAPTFLQDMMRTDLADGRGSSLACIVIAGAPIPRNLPTDASEALGAFISPAWGMTECSIITASSPDEDPAVLRTDGSVFAGSELRVVDLDGKDSGPDVEGDLLMRGPALALGYYDRPDATADAYRDGLWFATGDRAVLDGGGRLVLRGRTKDIVIRGGENIPVTDIESVLFDHPDVVNVAVIGVPDERLGERVRAVLVQRQGSAPVDLRAMSDYLLDAGLSKHYLPEDVVHLEEMPMTPSGKIQKFKLRGIGA